MTIIHIYIYTIIYSVYINPSYPRCSHSAHHVLEGFQGFSLAQNPRVGPVDWKYQGFVLIVRSEVLPSGNDQHNYWKLP